MAIPHSSWLAHAKWRKLFVKTHDGTQLLGPELTTENACSRPSNITISSKTLMRTLAFMCTSSCCVERCIVLLDNIVAILMALSSTSVNVLAYARQVGSQSISLMYDCNTMVGVMVVSTTPECIILKFL
uniref:Uncharacterized protein n=1 Tax=Cucumis sativus TaxID=3659 RepID=A0A0A0M3F1_CUCSA